MPKISVIVPVYKVEQYLNRCIDSILTQTFTDFELVLIDDGSPDNCGVMCDEQAKKDSRVRVIHQENGGLSAARNAGIDWAFTNSNSEYLSFIDSDDWVHKDYLKYLFDAIIEKKADVSICGYQEVEEWFDYYDIEPFEAECCDIGEYYRDNYVNATIAVGKLYKKECFNKMRYPVGKIHEDEFVTYKILFNASSVVIVEEKLYMYFNNSEGITKSKWTPERIVKLEAYREQIDFFKQEQLYELEKMRILNYIFFGTKQAIIAKRLSYLDISSQLIKTLKKELKKMQKNYSIFSGDFWKFKICLFLVSYCYGFFYFVYNLYDDARVKRSKTT